MTRRIDEGMLAKVVKTTMAEGSMRLPPRGWFRVSRVWDACPREQFFYHYFYDQFAEGVKTKVKPQMNAAMRIGTDFHAFLQEDVLGPLGVLKGTWKCKGCGREVKNQYYPSPCCQCGSTRYKYIEYEIEDKDLRLRGHIDGLVCLNRLKMVLEGHKADPHSPEDLVVLEIKTASEFAYKSAVKDNELPIYYRAQACSYQALCMDRRWIDKGVTLYLYFNRATGAFASFFYYMDDVLLEEVVGKVLFMRDSVDSGVLPEDRVCPSPDCSRAKECRFFDRCFLAEKGEELK